MHRLAISILSVVGILGSVVVGLSNAYVKSDPALASDINPWNASARKAVLMLQFRNLQHDPDPAPLIMQAKKLIRYSPVEARGYAVLGDGLYLLGQQEEAQRAHKIALSLSPFGEK